MTCLYPVTTTKYSGDERMVTTKPCDRCDACKARLKAEGKPEPLECFVNLTGGGTSWGWELICSHGLVIEGKSGFGDAVTAREDGMDFWEQNEGRVRLAVLQRKAEIEAEKAKALAE